MTSSPAPPPTPRCGEAERLAALAACGILDTAPEPEFDDLARLAAGICEAPVALVSLIDAERQWFKSAVGLGVRQTPLDTSICAHAIHHEAPFVVPDTLRDPRFAGMAVVVGPPRLRFYAGVPLRDAAGVAIGMLCVLDREPRPQGLTSWQVFALTVLARQVMSLIGMRRAVTAADAGLAESEARYRALYRRTPTPLHSLDPQGRLLAVSDRWLELLGYGEEEVIGRPLTDFLDESARRDFPGTWARMRREGMLRGHPACFLRRSGERLEALVWARAETDAEGRFRHSVGCLVDVTGQRELEEALRQSQKLEALGQLSAGVAHDFANVLQATMGGLAAAEARLHQPDRARQILRMTRDAVERGISLARRMLSFARKEATAPEAVEVAAVLDGLRELLGRVAGPGVRVVVEAPAALPAVSADRSQLDLVLLNLAINARDAMPRGGTLCVSACCVPPEEEAREPGLRAPHLRLAITDNGVGMPPEVLARAGEPFFTTKSRGQGTGLGLSMARGFCEQVGGALRIDSRVGEGTTVALLLPCAAAD
ncbi:ATP-binding protein [Roseomonas sp. NAR14]|uniref:histidine kinase n=1 Tax=Roseomonas acroporae TaxID=2937791 RepID=A0A9X1Y615_9PROT|nr:ATP-binding protein [Roseomonas acroporae]MCK8784161.1 ATP-binding protein [Roseomonas acroporae]